MLQRDLKQIEMTKQFCSCYSTWASHVIISNRGLIETVVDPKVIFSVALKRPALGLILHVLKYYNDNIVSFTKFTRLSKR